MFCSNCGASNVEKATYCTKCGTPLGEAVTSPVQAAQSGSAAAPFQSGNRKNPLVAAILNLFFGIGYLYLGYKKVLGLPAIVFVIVVFVFDVVVGIFTFGIVSFVLAIAMAYDGYVKAKGQKGFVGTEPAMLYQP